MASKTCATCANATHKMTTEPCVTCIEQGDGQKSAPLQHVDG